MQAEHRTMQREVGEVAAGLHRAAREFLELVGCDDPRVRLRHAAGLREVEGEAEGLYSDVLHAEASRVIAPYEREGVLRLVRQFDDVVDQLDHAGRMLIGFGLWSLPPQLIACAQVLDEMGSLCQEAVLLIDTPAELGHSLSRLRKLSDTSKELHRDLLVQQVEVMDLKDFVKVNALAGSVMEAAAGMGEFGRALEIIAVTASETA